MQTYTRILSLAALVFIPALANSQSLSVKWEELTSPDFVKAIHQSEGVCILPFGIIEKHGPQLPLGTDLINIRYLADRAAEQEYAVVFPDYYFGQIFEARHEPGTVTVPICSWNCSRRPLTKWRETAAEKFLSPTGTAATIACCLTSRNRKWLRSTTTSSTSTPAATIRRAVQS